MPTPLLAVGAFDNAFFDVRKLLKLKYKVLEVDSGHCGI
jgi:hypothetical protein